jgi:bacteriocin-like protein
MTNMRELDATELATVEGGIYAQWIIAGIITGYLIANYS